MTRMTGAGVSRPLRYSFFIVIPNRATLGESLP
jgi:hypothetical protein